MTSQEKIRFLLGMKKIGRGIANIYFDTCLKVRKLLMLCSGGGGLFSQYLKVLVFSWEDFPHMDSHLVLSCPTLPLYISTSRRERNIA